MTPARAWSWSWPGSCPRGHEPTCGTSRSSLELRQQPINFRSRLASDTRENRASHQLWEEYRGCLPSFSRFGGWHLFSGAAGHGFSWSLPKPGEIGLGKAAQLPRCLCRNPAFRSLEERLEPAGLARLQVNLAFCFHCQSALQNPAGEIDAEFVLDVCRHGPLGVSPLKPALEVL